MSEPLLFMIHEILLDQRDGRHVAWRRGESQPWQVNAVAADILRALAEPMTRLELVAHLRHSYAIDEAARAVIDGFVDTLIGQGWVEAVPDRLAGGQAGLRYLRLLRRALVNLLYPEHELWLRYLESPERAPDRLARERALRDIRSWRPETYEALLACKRTGGVMFGEPTRDAHTMVGLRRLDNLEYCARRIMLDGVPGDFLEAGVCQGGASIYLRALQHALGEPGRRTWVADSFQGLPPPRLEEEAGLDLTESRFPWLAISEAQVREHFARYQLLDEGVRFLPGWFSETLAGSDTGPLALLRIDADLYESTRDVLEALHDRVSPGGYVIIDDYRAFACCQQAVDEFRSRHGIVAPLHDIDWTSVFWRKP